MKVLSYLISAVNFTNILRAAFMPISFRQKSTNLKCKYKKAAQKNCVQKAAHKMLVKLTPGQLFSGKSSLQNGDLT